ncbi:Uu.00g019640.m01.CDS01 [Anthostomella pinea]|uniref:Uu.00g019640.m01.CDS01 n=1 Tax=Anthostomella pinea TaxID=933095 RepID=A0AAI8W087_9PEZI|nr:Uu.00g019640.m01.CDS01 [Anthostomella pinea]
MILFQDHRARDICLVTTPIETRPFLLLQEFYTTLGFHVLRMFRRVRAKSVDSQSLLTLVARAVE